MQELQFILENVDPLLFSERGADNILFTTKHYVPGSAIRGALAHLYIAKHKLQAAYQDETFYTLFLSGKVRFLPAYPIGCLELANGEPLLMPLSLMRSKDKTQLVDLTATSEQKAGFKKLQGFVVQQGEKIYQIDTKVKIELHMSRNEAGERLTGTSKEGKVFNYEYLEPGQLFKGAFVADDDVFPLLKQALQDLELTELYLGRSKSAQYGKCLYKEMSENVQQIEVAGETLYLLAQTPYIAYGSWQCVKAAAQELLSELEQRLGVAVTKENLRIFAAMENIDGYVGVWQAKKQAERALSAGSLLELRLAENVPADKLQQVLLQGLGKAVEDGYGQFVIWQPLAKPQLAETLPEKQQKNMALNNDVKLAAKKVIHERLLQEVRQQAARDAQSDRLKIKTENAHNIFKRIEGLMYSGKSKKEIQMIISVDFKDAAKNNLRKIKYNDDALYDILVESEGYALPYRGLDWIRKLNLPGGSLKNLQGLLGSSAFILTADEVYSEYWLWFVRHAVKLNQEEGKY